MQTARETAQDVATAYRRIQTPVLTEEDKLLVSQYIEKVSGETGIRLNAGQAVWMAALRTMRAEIPQSQTTNHNEADAE